MQTLPSHLPPVPVMETERLILRGHRIEDFEAFHAMWSHPTTFAMISGKAATPAESQGKILGNIGHWAAFGWGYWAVEDKATGAFVGDVGLGRFRRDITPSINEMPEIGWVLAPAFHGKGYATEAARAALGWMDAAMPGTPTCCIFHPDNTGSMRVAEKLGYSFWQTAQFKGEDTQVYRRKTETGN